MHIGVLISPNGTVKRTWALISGPCAVPIEHGDEVIDWSMAHGHEEPDPQQREIQTSAAIAMQDALAQMTTREHVLSASEPHAHVRRHHRFIGPPSPQADRETMYHSDGRLVSRARGATHVPTDDAEGHLEAVRHPSPQREEPA